MNAKEIKIRLSEFYEHLNPSLGVEGAQKILRDAISVAGLDLKAEYTKTEALKLCESLETFGGYVTFIAINLQARFSLRGKL